MLPYFTIGGRIVPFYGICYFGGIFLSGLFAALLCKKRGIDRYDVVGSGIYAVICGAVGAKLLFLAVSARQLIEMHLGLEAILKGGFVFYGGLLGGMAGIWIYTKQFHLPLADFFDLFAVVLPLGHAVGRVGCFFSGCCYGLAYDGPLSYTYTYAFGDTPIGVPLLPIQLIEAVCLFGLFVCLLFIYIKKPQKRGMPAYGYVFGYATLRFVLEFFRGDYARGLFGLFSTSQWISLALFCVAAVLLIRKKKKGSAAEVKNGV